VFTNAGGYLIVDVLQDVYIGSGFDPYRRRIGHRN
jgi:hypothetical protein